MGMHDRVTFVSACGGVRVPTVFNSYGAIAHICRRWSETNFVQQVDLYRGCLFRYQRDGYINFSFFNFHSFKDLQYAQNME